MVQLSQSNETFCQRLFVTGDQPQSYLDAGHECKDLLVASAAATRLLKNVKIQERMAELNERVAKGTVATVQERKEILTTIARDKSPERTRAIQELNKMDGAYAPEQLEVLAVVQTHITGYKRVERKG